MERQSCNSQEKLDPDRGSENLWQSSQLHCFALQRLVSQTSPMPRPTAAGGSTAADLAAFMAGFTPAAFMPVDFTPVDFTPVDFTPAAFMPVDFTPAGFMAVDFALARFMVDFTAVSPGCTMVSATDTELIGSTAGTTDALAGGGATG
jgi:hypothetical protein